MQNAPIATIFSTMNNCNSFTDRESQISSIVLDCMAARRPTSSIEAYITYANLTEAGNAIAETPPTSQAAFADRRRGKGSTSRLTGFTGDIALTYRYEEELWGQEKE